jgi:hypothetical protein
MVQGTSAGCVAAQIQIGPASFAILPQLLPLRRAVADFFATIDRVQLSIAVRNPKPRGVEQRLEELSYERA